MDINADTAKLSRQLKRFIRSKADENNLSDEAIKDILREYAEINKEIVRAAWLSGYASGLISD